MSLDRSLRRWDVPEISTHTMVLRRSHRQLYSAECKSEYSKYRCIKARYSTESRTWYEGAVDSFSSQKNISQLKRNGSCTVGDLKQYIKTSSATHSSLYQPEHQVKCVNNEDVSSLVDKTHASSHEYVNDINVKKCVSLINYLSHDGEKLNSSGVFLTSHYTTSFDTMPKRGTGRGRGKSTGRRSSVKRNVNVSSSEDEDVHLRTLDNSSQSGTSNYFFRLTPARSIASSSRETVLTNRMSRTAVASSRTGVRNSSTSELRLFDQDVGDENGDGDVCCDNDEAEENLLYGLLHVETNHVSGLSGYITLLKKWLYFCLLKPMHLDVEFLSRANRIGKRKILFFALLPLLLGLLLFLVYPREKQQLFITNKETPVIAGAAGQFSFLDEFGHVDDSFNSTSDVNMHLSPGSFSEHVAHSGDQSFINVDESEVRSLVKQFLAQKLHLSQSFTDDLSNLKAIKQEMSDELDFVKKELGEAKRKLRNVEKSATELISFINDFKNCCRNDSDLIALMERRMKFMVNALLNEHGNGSFQPFQDWLDKNFVGHAKFASVENGIKLDEEKIMQSIEARMEDLRVSLQSDTPIRSDIAEAQLIFKKMLQQYDADKTGQADYALESGGGSIVSTRCSETYSERNPRITVLGLPLWYGSNSPRNAIQPSMHPGQCWAFKGTNGYLVIQLAATIIPTGFVIEHIPKSISPTGNIDSAPKDFSVYGLETEKDTEGNLLGKYSYKKDGDALQYFPVQVKDTTPYSFVELKVHSNHGDMNYTCLYRFRVHGLRP